MESRPEARPSRRRRRGAKPKTKTEADAFTLDGTSGPRPGFGFLSDAAIAKVKARAFDLLKNYGVVVIHPAAAEALKKAGAGAGRDSDRLRLPVTLVEEALAATPKKVTLCGKNTARDVHLPRADGGFIMRTGTGAHGYVDPDTAQYRNVDLDAVADIAAVGTGLDEVGFIAHPFVHGVPELTSDIHSLGALISRTDKHVWMQPMSITRTGS